MKKIIGKIIDIACCVVAFFGTIVLLAFVLWMMVAERTVEGKKCDGLES